MLELKYIRENMSALEEMLTNRGSKISLEELRILDEERRKILSEVENLKYQKNTSSALVAEKKKSGEDASEIITKMGSFF